MNKSIFKKRRQELMRMMENGIAVIPTGSEMPRNGGLWRCMA